MHQTMKQSLIEGVTSLWKSPAKTRQPWWKSLVSSPAQRIADSQSKLDSSSSALFTLPDPVQNDQHGSVAKKRKTKKMGGDKVRPDLPVRRSCANIPKASLKRVITLAKSKQALHKAVKDIEEDYFPNSSKASKQAKRNAIEAILRSAFTKALPLDVNKLKALSGALREAGHKSSHLYLAEAKIAHIEAGWQWTHLLDRHFKLCTKAVNRGKGPAKKAIEVPEADWPAHSLLPGPQGPETTVNLAPHLFACGVHWMMREIEIAGLRTKDAIFDRLNSRLVTLTWNKSKMDQEGATIKRTLQCTCGGACDLKCPCYAMLETLMLYKHV